MADYATPSTDKPKDGEEKKEKTGKHWLDEIEQAERDLGSYQERAKKIVDLYTRHRETTATSERKYAMLWANIEVLKPATYARSPQPSVNRRFSDKDPLGRYTAETIQRCLSSIFDTSDIDSCLKSCRDDFLLVGRGTPWVRYVPSFENKTLEGQTVEALKDETLAFDFVHHTDFVHPKCRAWVDLPWVARRVHLDKAKFIERFGEEKYKKLSEKPARESHGYGKDGKQDICTYELWSKRDNKVLWLAKGCEDVLDEKPPLYDLRDFWPCPKPAFATCATDSLIPVPDYVFYQDQAEEIDDLTKRIAALTDALKLTGFYPAGAEGEISTAIESALSPHSGNQMIPVPSWAAFVQGGGAKQMIEWLPVEMVVKVLQGCVELRNQLIEDVYQITGISDIIRGQGEASETATAQNIKAQWGGIRIRDRQSEMVRLSRDITRIAAEIVAERFQPETIFRLSGMSLPTQEQKEQAQLQIQQLQMQPALPDQPPVEIPPQVEQMLKLPTQEEVIQLLRDDRMRSYRIDIETDSTIEADEQAEKASRNEFLQVVGAFMQQAIPAAQAQPALVPMLGEMLMFTVRGYRAGRQLEDVIQQAVDDLSAAAQQAATAPVPQDPKMVEVEGRLQLERDRFEHEKQQAATERVAAGIPEGIQFMDITNDLKATVGALGQTTSDMAQNFQMVMQAIAGIAQQQAAPVELVRDETGAAVAVRKGGVVQQVVFGPDGRAAGLAPMDAPSLQ